MRTNKSRPKSEATGLHLFLLFEHTLLLFVVVNSTLQAPGFHLLLIQLPSQQIHLILLLLQCLLHSAFVLIDIVNSSSLAEVFEDSVFHLADLRL
jgi:hypothetical protein